MGTCVGNNAIKYHYDIYLKNEGIGIGKAIIDTIKHFNKLEIINLFYLNFEKKTYN